MAKGENRQNDLVGWVGFEGRAAYLRRVIVPGGMRGLLLRTGSSESGEKVRENAISFGFKELKTRGTLRMLFPDGKVPFSARILAEALGGKVIPISRGEMLSAKWTINLSERAPSIKQVQKPERPQPDPENISVIGLNIRGEEVVRDDSGRFFRKVSQEDGTSRYVHEAEGEKHTLFLRAARTEDLEVIASSLLKMAGRGTLHMADFNRVVEAALEEGSHGRLEISKAEASEQIRYHMMREITAVAVENDASRDKFLSALRLSNSTGFVLSRHTEKGAPLSPSPAIAAFLRRATRGSPSVDFRGSEDLKVAMPRLIRKESSLQVHDLADIPEDGIPAYAANVLARREADGRTILRLDGATAPETVELLRSDLGRAYALECVAEISAAVADGVQDGNPSTIFFVGERRPEPLDALPQAALRNFQVLTTDDLQNLEREILRSRSRIRDFHQGVEEDAGSSPDDREENKRQKPYQPLSRVKEPFTMIPVALEGATAKALDRVRRDMEDQGGVDSVVGSLLGQDFEGLGNILTAEQVDAVALWKNARDRDRGFLLADQTGVGKGRSLAAMVRAHLRSGIAPRVETDIEAGREIHGDAETPEVEVHETRRKKVIYFTESATINIPDVCRDIVDVGAWGEARMMFLSTGSQVTVETTDPVTGEPMEQSLSSPRPSVRKAILESEQWPDDVDLIITTYSQFRGKEGDPAYHWIRSALDEDTLIVFDEAHNALNERSGQGMNARAAIEAVGGGQNVVFATATPSRDPSGMNLYTPLLPNIAEATMGDLLNNIKSGGEVAQEAFATMLSEDGVMLRRDHDLSNIEFRVELPSDELMLQYQQIMNQFSPIVEMMIDANIRIGEHQGRRQSADYFRAINRGLSPQAARSQSNALNQYSIALGSPLSNLSRIVMNAAKTAPIVNVGQIVDVALREIEEGRKPMITFHSTNASLMSEAARGPDGKISEESMAAASGLSLRDQILRIHESMYIIRIDGEKMDSRRMYPDVAEASRAIEAAILDLPENMSAFPVDDLIQQLEENGISVGEVSGRTLCYRDGQIRRRTKEERNRRETINRFNDGETDILIYNAAGATGGSFHASPKFKDQRPRTIIEMEAPLDIIKYVQGLGRGNRYGQVAKPRVVSVMTGLTPEMRILQQRNRKLRSLGASVDGNRSHPMLLDDVPDLLNKVGDEATRNVLLSMPALARRIGFPEYAEEDAAAFTVIDDGSDTGSGASVGSGAESLSNKILTRSIMLNAADQEDLVQRIRMEFDALIEELESRNANPLRPKTLEGQLDIRATSIYSGKEREDDDLDTSAFLSPLYISTGVHHFNEKAWDADQLVTAIEASRRLYGAEGFEPFAERINQNLPALLRPYLPEGVEMQDAMDDPRIGGGRFENRHKRLTDLAWLLENMRPGVAIRFPSESDHHGLIRRTIVGLTPPSHPSHYDVPSAYKIQTIAPGMAKPETTAVSRLTTRDMEKIFFRPGLSEGFDETYLEEFNEEGMLSRRLPVQILSGNILQAISESAQHDLGSISLYRDMEDLVHRGIVVSKGKVDLEKLPVQVPSGRVAAELAYRFISDPSHREKHGMLKIWAGDTPGGAAGDRSEADIIISITAKTFTIEPIPLRKSTEAFYRERPGLFEVIFGKDMPAPDDVPLRAYRRAGARGSIHMERFTLDTDGNKNRALEILTHLDGLPMMTDGVRREAVNEISVDIDRIAGAGPAFHEARDDLDQSDEADPVADDAASNLAGEEAVAPDTEEAEEDWREDLDTADFDNVDWR